ncbi:hypothetical protein HS041_28315 [Planomonospora sp. ID67723]|uniref:LamG-like jellyroll fold domain-containing protein n=1 Tax=Planomonospora sp. ID67723 TaxID=2738134 RepID=UPI0018C39E61|nr:LamG-like jellyroll fold domain-containing protein [Planomonospora sp. ID67723]MBG0831639.1 hypothetical protein [Planomonospora sp. ID67723]
MRRSLSWSRSAGRTTWLTAALTVALTPGLLTMHAPAVSADGLSITRATAPVDTPDQLTGSAANLPSLVDAKATTTTVPMPEAKQDARPPKNALAPEQRLIDENAGKAGNNSEPTQPAEPASVRRTPSKQPLIRNASSRASATDTAAAPKQPAVRQASFATNTGSVNAGNALIENYCDRYRYFDSMTLYPPGSVVTYKDRVWTAMKEAIGQWPGGGWGGYWSDGGPCPPPSTPPPPAPKAPTLSKTFPTDQMLVDSRTPLLVAGGWSNEGSYAVRFTFTVCDTEQMSGDGCFSSGELGNNVNSWRVPETKTLAWSKQYWWTVSVRDTSNNLTADSGRQSFTTGVRQPAITSQLAARGANGQEFHQLTGNYTTTFTDATVASAGPPLSIVRSYNSMDPRKDGLFGAGWSTRFDMKIRPETAGAVKTLLVTYPDGRQVRFADNGDGTFQPPPGMYATLVEVLQPAPCSTEVPAACPQTMVPAGWRLMDKSSTSYGFDTQGRLTKVTDAYNRSIELEHAADGKLSKVSAPGGRYLTFTWNGAHVASVSTPPVDGQTLTWNYTYQGDQLVKVCTPTATPTCTTFGYGDGSLYRSSVLDSDALGYWRLNETSETTAADSGWSEGPAAYSSVTLAQPGALAGTGDTAATFSGGAKLTLPPDSLARLQGAASFETWFKTTGPGTVLAIGGAAGLLYVGNDGRLRGQLRKVQGSTPIAPITSTATVTDGAWHHVVLTLTETEQRMYLDGQQAGVLIGIPVAGWPSTATVGTGTIFGTWPSAPASGSFAFNGQIDEVALYAKPLAIEEAQAHYAARAAVPYKLTKITLPSGRIWAANTYNAATDRLASHTDAHGGTWQLSAPVYSAETGMSTVKVTDPNVNTLTSVHDAWRGYRLASQTDQLGKTTKFDYDTGGFLSKITDPNGNVTEQVNDARGNVIAVTTCRTVGNCQITRQSFYLNKDDEFDPRNDKVTVSRDARSTSASDTTYATAFDYTTRGDLAKVTTPATPDFPEGRSAISTYTDGTEPAVGEGTMPAGLLKSQKNARGDETTYRYTASGDLTEQITPAGLKSTFTHDALGRVISRTEISEAYPDGVTSTFTYDGSGRLLAQTDPDVKNEITGITHTTKTTYTYDADGNRLTETVADLTGGDPAQTTAYTYDAAGRVKSVTDPEGSVVTSTWDITGALTSATDPMGTLHTFAYTKRGEPASTTIKNWTGSPVAPQTARDVVLESYAYDPAGRLATKADAMGRKTSYTYFADNRLSQAIADEVRLNGSTTPTDVVLESNTYDAAGNLTKQVTGGGKATTDYVYDAAGLMRSTTFDSAELRRKTAYTHDAVGNITTEAFTGTDSNRVESTNYAYNALGQVIRQSIDNGDTDLTSIWTYDERGLLVKQTDPRGNADGAEAGDFTTTMRYDLVGRLVESTAPQVKIEKNGSATAGRPTVRYGYNNIGLATHTVDAEGRLLTSTFDKAGRLTSTTGTPYTVPDLDSGSGPIGGEVGSWKMEEGSGTELTDSSGRGRTATLAGPVVRGEGKIGQGVTFDAGTHAVTSAPVLATDASYTVSAWVKLTRGDLSSAVLSQDGAVNSAFKLAYSSGDKKWRIAAYGTDAAGSTETKAVSSREARLNAWTHLTGVYDAQARKLRLYEDGELVAETDYTSTWNATGGLLIGRTKFDGSYQHSFRGTIDEVRAYDKALPADQIRTLITTPKPAADGRVGSWKMEEGSGNQLTDSSGRGRAATLAGPVVRGEGKIGQGVTFDAGTHAVTSAPVLATDASYTVSAWVKLTRGDLSSAVLSQDGAVNSAFKLAYSSGDKKWRIAAYGTDAAGSTETKAVSSREARLNAWTHLTGVYDAQARKLRLYEDGELVAETDYTSTWNATGGLLIGRTKFDGSYQHSFRGTIDEVRAYDKALTADQVRGLTATMIPKTVYGYDAAGRQISVTDPRGYTTTTEYDALSRPVRITEPGPSGPGGARVAEFDLVGEQLAVIDPTGARSEATYDDLGRTITQTVIERRPTTAALTTTLTYDTAGNLTKAVAPGGKITSYAVNAAGQVTAITDPNGNTTSHAYDAVGRETKVTDPLGNVTEITYDLAGRKIAAKDLDAAGATVRNVGFGYDPAGNLTHSTSAEGHVTRQEFDALGRMTALIEPVSADKSITTTFGYDAVGARTRLTDGRGNATWTSYNSLGLVESLIEPSTTAHPNAADRTWTQIYDAASNNTATLQPGGVRIDRTFDHLGRTVSERGSGAAVETPQRTYGYDAAGRPSAIGDYGLEYNDRGLLTKLSKAAAQVATYAYDALGNPTQRVDPTGTANFTWDNGSRLATASDPVTGRTWTYGYDKADRLTSQTSANPINIHTFAYDAVDRPTSHTLTGSGGAELAKIVYGWDKDDRLTSKTTSGTAGAGSNSYGYDHAGRLTSWTGPDGKSVDYAWDESGNRIKAGDTTFTYDERNRLTSGAGVDYTYSPRGTLATETTGGTTKNLVFDAFDRLITDGETSYGYDALGRMTSRTKGTAQQRFTYSGLSNDISVIADGVGAVQATYGRDVAGGLLSMHEGGSPALGVMNDLHGDVVATFSGTALVDSTAYDPFGQVTHTSGSKRSMGYQGEYTDPDTGKVNMHARWYQPGTGAFTSRDDWTLDPNPSVQANRYTYANASPLTGTDPTGHEMINTISDDRPREYSGVCDESCLYSWDPTPADLRFHGTTEEDLAWHEANFGGRGWIPELSEEEARRIGYLTTGDPAPDGYWRATKKQRAKYIEGYDRNAADEYNNALWIIIIGKNPKVKAGGFFAKLATAPPPRKLNACEKKWGVEQCRMPLSVSLNGDLLFPPSAHAFAKAVKNAKDHLCYKRIRCSGWATPEGQAYLHLYVCVHNKTWCGDTWAAKNSIGQEDPYAIKEMGFGSAAARLGNLLKATSKLAAGFRNNTVYVGYDASGNIIYVGITKNFAKRSQQHGARFTMRAIANGLTRGEARAIEQAVIHRHMMGGGRFNLTNKINSISPKHPYYQNMVNWGVRWLRSNAPHLL